MSTEPKTPVVEEQTLPLRTPREASVGEVAAEQPHGPRRILVLGATSGIAEACIRLWANRGDALYLVARNADKLAVVAADARTRGASHIGSAVANLDNTGEHAEVLAHAINSLGGLDVAFLALGVLGDQGDAEKNFAAADQILHTNFVAPVSLLTWLANYTAQRHAGTLAVLSSVAGERGPWRRFTFGTEMAVGFGGSRTSRSGVIVKKGRHRRFEEARSLKRSVEAVVEPCPECRAMPGTEHASWCLAMEDEEDQEGDGEVEVEESPELDRTDSHQY